MNKTLIVFALLTLAVCVFGVAMNSIAIAQSAAQHRRAQYPASFTAQTNRPCLYDEESTIVVDCSDVAAATSTQLNAWSVYEYSCQSAAYVEWGDDSAIEADDQDMIIPANAWNVFSTSDSVGRYFSCLNVLDDTDCRVRECR
jgi:hypothetical protein